MTPRAPWRTCPVTGRTWPAVAAFDLRTCARCGGIIDTRHDGWWDAVRAGLGVAHIHCPEAAIATPVPAVAP